MLIQQKLGNLQKINTSKKIDWVTLQWYETGKRILHKKTRSGVDIVIKFLNENPLLTQGDILYEDAKTLIAVEIEPCDAIVINPKNMFEMATICYKIGNKHLPLFYHNDELMIAYEAPLFNLFVSLGYEVSKQNRKLLDPLTTSVASHAHTGSGSLFSKIMKLSSPKT